MKLTKKMGAIVLGILLLQVIARAEQPWLSAEDYESITIILPDQPSESELRAAGVFQDYWEQTTGYLAEISMDALEGTSVWIGRSAAPSELLEGIDFEALEADGIVVKTFGDVMDIPEDRHLLLAGGERMGVLYATYEFFHQAMGVRWLTPEVTHIPEAPEEIGQLDIVHTPTFVYRFSTYYDHFYGSAEHEEFFHANHITQYPHYGLFVHTAYTLLPPEKYFKDHPEYYSEIDGRRVAPQGWDWSDPSQTSEHLGELGQLCWGRPETAEAILAELRPRMRANPEAKIWSVSQMDWFDNCQCEICRAIDEQEGSPMGSLLTCINRIADGIRAEFPDNYISTLAYQYTRIPPKNIKPRDNVIIRLCSIECDFSTPLEAGAFPDNVAFRNDIEEWAKIAKTLYIWDYTPSYHSYHKPHPNFQVLGPNARFFAEHNVRGLFEQGAETPGAEMAPLRGYMLARLMWDPYADAEALKNEFIELYFGKAAPQIQLYIELTTNKVLSEKIFMGCFDPGRWMDLDMVRQAQAIFDRAFAAAENETIRRRVDQEYLAVQWSALVCPPKVTIKDGMLYTERPKQTMTFEQYKKRMKEFGLGQIHTYSLDSTQARLDNDLFRNEKTADLVRLENDRYLVWIVPKFAGAVIRWYDKQNDLELLRAAKDFWNAPGRIEDWRFTPGVEERPIVSRYDLIESTSNTAVIEGQSKSGLRVRREMALSDAGFDIKLSYRNESDVPSTTTVKIHPEFYLNEPQIPKLWVHRGKGWEPRDTPMAPFSYVYGTILQPEDFDAIAFESPDAGYSVICDFDPSQTENILYFFAARRDTMHANLEVIPQSGALAPGEERTVSASYRVVTGQPSE